jgi:hypothetical protein
LQVPTSLPTPQPTPVPTLMPSPLPTPPPSLDPTLAPTPLPSLVSLTCERARLVDFIHSQVYAEVCHTCLLMHSSQPSPDALTHLSSNELVLTCLHCYLTFPDSFVLRQLPTPIPSSAPTSLPTSLPTPVNMPPMLYKATPESRLILRPVIYVCLGLILFFLSFLQVPTSVPTPQPTPVPTLMPTPLPTLLPTPLPSLVNHSCERARLVNFI